MLKREIARERLDEFKVKDWEERRRQDLQNLPAALNALGLTLLGLDDRPYYPEVDEQIRLIGTLPADQRAQLFSAVFPRIDSYVCQAYDLLLTLPCQRGYYRRAFRSPNPDHHGDARQGLLRALVWITREYEQPLDWYAAWAPYLSHGADDLGFVFAAAINQGDAVGEQVFEILCGSARGEHEIGGMGRHVVRALLVAHRPEGWQLIENLLVAAQRQEGLRQVILETIDEAHPQAFQQLLRVILEQNLVRFSATIRAADVWLGLHWDVDQRRWVQSSLEQLLTFLEHPKQRALALSGDDPHQIYLALWLLAFAEMESAIAPAITLLQHKRVEIRFVAAYLLRQLAIPEAQVAIAPALADSNPRVAVEAFWALRYTTPELGESLFEALEAFLARFPAQQTQLETLVWPWMQASISQTAIGDELVKNLGDRAPHRLIPYLAKMDAWAKVQTSKLLVALQPWDDTTREAVFGLMRDRSSYVREEVLSQLKQHRYIPSAAEAKTLENLLTRKAADLRRGVLLLLLQQDDDAAMTSAQRLLKTTQAPQRLAGLELLHQLQQAERADCRPLAEQYAQDSPKRSASEQERLDQLLAHQQDIPTLEDALGLAPQTQRTQTVRPQVPAQTIPLLSEAAQRVLQSLDQLIEQHRTELIQVPGYDGPQTELLGNIYSYQFPEPDPQLSLAENLERLPLAEVWQTWRQERPHELRDPDGLELVRALVPFTSENRCPYYYAYRFGGFQDTRPDWVGHLLEQWYVATDQLQSDLVSSLLKWLLFLEPPAHIADALLNAAQSVLATVLETATPPPYDWRNTELMAWVDFARLHHQRHPDAWSKAQIQQLWPLLRWLDEPQSDLLPQWCLVEKSSHHWGSYQQVETGGFIRRCRPELQEVMAAFAAGAATEADVYDQLLGVRDLTSDFTDLQTLTRRKPHPLFKTYPELADLVARCRDRILNLELSRGDLPTAATDPALSLKSISGIPTLIKLLQNLGHHKLARGWVSDSQSKASVFSHLLRVSFPAEADTPQAFAQQAKATQLSEQVLVELAMYAPQWCRYVEQATGWKNLTEAVWWFHAHTRDDAWHVDSEIRELWAAQITELTPLSSTDLIDGAVDVAWFQRIYKRLSAQQWGTLNEAAKYTSGGGGHKRAQLFAEAMTGQTNRSTLIQRIQDKRHQDAVRSLGLLPLAKGSKKRQTDLLERYQVIQEFLRTSRKFGSQRQASEKLAARIGMENLARTAGYPDPQRLEWAMEGVAIADLAQGSVEVTVDAVTVSLSLTPAGNPQMTVTKNGKSLKNIPAALKKNPDIKQLQARKRDLMRQASRMRQSLEQAMCRGDQFTAAELKQLLTHPILRPILERLVFINLDTDTCGCLREDALLNHDGSTLSITAQMHLRIAHPVDLAASGTWHLWQQYCFTQEQIQPFKQIFRELYVPTLAEQQAGGNGSSRYAGHQVNPRQALALLGNRGWVTHPEEGVRRTFHEENLLVWVDFEEGWFTPTEVEGLTLAQVCFADRKDYKTLGLETVPPRVFSEIMRDLDLVVSVAHQGGVDPETSASTVEMRAALLRETSRLLNIKNIHLQEPHALIEGQLGSYTLHLGSATVHRQPGGALCIVPVHSQHRGRLFLPFTDDDPKTAEVISKALLLAEDQAIQDPTILEQLL
jgi:hypothetical protein